MRRVSGGPVVVHIRAAWQANTAYYQGDVYTYLGGAYEVTSPYTSGGSFGASDLANTAVFESQSGTSATILPAIGSFTYDSNGNPLTDPDGNTYTWNADGTVHTQTKGGVTRTFSYDASGNLTGVA